MTPNAKRIKWEISPTANNFHTHYRNKIICVKAKD
uniref:Uncharacterized protein n=1 Tax=Arundo donax TaxID=35708 RepID=A0A0A9H586_ARUDO